MNQFWWSDRPCWNKCFWSWILTEVWLWNVAPLSEQRLMNSTSQVQRRIVNKILNSLNLHSNFQIFLTIQNLFSLACSQYPNSALKSVLSVTSFGHKEVWIFCKNTYIRDTHCLHKGQKTPVQLPGCGLFLLLFPCIRGLKTTHPCPSQLWTTI